MVSSPSLPYFIPNVHSFAEPSSVNCQEGDIRLADGLIDNEGRVEFCVNGVWGSVCTDGWDKTDAHIVCTQLGHPELGELEIVSKVL